LRGAGKPVPPERGLSPESWPFSLSQAETATLTFDLWLWQATGDTFAWGASIDGTHFYGVTVTEAFSTTWGTHSFDLSAVPTLGDLRGEQNVWIAFDWHTDGLAETFLGAFLDNVKVEKSIPDANTRTPTATHTATRTVTRTPTVTGTPVGPNYLPILLRPRVSPTPSLTPTITRTKDPNNHPPVFPSPFNSSQNTTYTYDELGRLTGATTIILILTPATDIDGDPISYSWSATNGTITGNGLEATWNRVISFGQVLGGTVTVMASDGRGGSTTAQIIFP
jgi:hypothetical protein